MHVSKSYEPLQLVVNQCKAKNTYDTAFLGKGAKRHQLWKMKLIFSEGHQSQQQESWKSENSKKKKNQTNHGSKIPHAVQSFFYLFGIFLFFFLK